MKVNIIPDWRRIQQFISRPKWTIVKIELHPSILDEFEVTFYHC